MNKVLSLLLALVMCLSLCACGETEDTPNQTEPIETRYLSDMLQELSNGAKAEMNIGKGTMVYGQINTITSEYCTVNLIKPKNTRVNVNMPTEILANLNDNQFIAITAVVESVNKRADTGVAFGYTLKSTEIADLSLMDEYVKTFVGIYSEQDPVKSAYGRADYMASIFDCEMLIKYVKYRSASFVIKDNEKLTAYLIGSWDSSGKYRDAVNFKANGTYDRTYEVTDIITGKKKTGNQSSDWDVNEGAINGYNLNDTHTIYAISDMVCVFDDTLYVKEW